MTDATVDDTETEKKKPSKLPLIIGLVLAIVGGAGGFFAVQAGFIGGGSKSPQAAEMPENNGELAPLPDVTFVEVPEITISLAGQANVKHLRFRTSLEVPSQYADDVTKILPRILDVMNSYLRALEATDFEQSAALIRIRGQLLRRIQLVAGQDRISALLVLEFFLN